jgi:hypothetical protein
MRQLAQVILLQGGGPEEMQAGLCSDNVAGGGNGIAG